MRAIDIEKALPGMVLAKTIYSADNRPLLREGTELTDRYLAALRGMKFASIYIVDARAPELQAHDLIADELRQEAMSTIRSAFGSEVGGSSRIGAQLGAVAKVTKQIVESILNNREMTIEMADLKNHDSYTFGHSVNVCVLGTVLGYRLGLDEGRLKDLALGLILHDVGKSGIPSEILDKPGKLTESEFEVMKDHCRAGFDHLRGVSSLSAHAKIVVLQHHEKWDGTGYPKGLQGDDIHLNAQIGAIADVYDALTSDKPYRKRYLPHEAIDYLIATRGTQFSDELVETFVGTVAPYPPGTLLLLSSREIGIVIDVDMKASARPIVKILQDTSGKPLAGVDAKYLDLKNRPDLLIAKVLPDA